MADDSPIDTMSDSGGEPDQVGRDSSPDERGERESAPRDDGRADAGVPAAAPQARSGSDDGTPPNPEAPEDADDYSSAVPGVSGVVADVFPWLGPAEAADEIGRLAGYRVLRRLGGGGMGIVFLVERLLSGRRLAMKVLNPAVWALPDAHERFVAEAQATAALNDDHVVPIYHLGIDLGVPFIVMPLLEGETLEDRLRRQPRLPLPQALRVGIDAAKGLSAAHAAGLIHRDIKPGNLWLEGEPGHDEFRRVKVLDFGLARSTALGPEDGYPEAETIVGTPGYMSPEQAGGKPVDPRSDLFSLGCVLYRITTGQRAFHGKRLSSLVRAAIVQQPAPPQVVHPDLPAPVTELIKRLLAKNPDDRPASAAEVVAVLQQILAGIEPPAGPADGQAGDRPGWLNRLFLGFAAALALSNAPVAWDR